MADEERLDDLEARLRAMEVRHEQWVTALDAYLRDVEDKMDGYIRQTNENLVKIGQQNAALSEMVEMAGRAGAIHAAEAIAQHVREEHG